MTSEFWFPLGGFGASFLAGVSGVGSGSLAGGIPGAMVGTWMCHRLPQRPLRLIMSVAIGDAAWRLLQQFSPALDFGWKGDGCG